MSASTRPGKNDPGPTDDDAWPDRNAYAIDIPDALEQAYPTAESAQEALALAEAAATTTDDGEQPTCPFCASVRVTPRPGGAQEHRVDAYYRCTNCDTPLSPPGGLTFGDGVVPQAAARAVVPVAVGSASYYHLADGCSFCGGVEETATAGELADRGLEPCGECAADAVGECHNCGTVTFDAVAGAPQVVCAECTEADDE